MPAGSGGLPGVSIWTRDAFVSDDSGTRGVFWIMGLLLLLLFLLLLLLLVIVPAPG